MAQRKVFAIGFHRTATTSFQTALEELGYKVVGHRPQDWDAFEEMRWDDLVPTIEAFDAFRDMPWPLLYRWLHKRYPDARFVLTYRDPESWAASCSGNCKDRPYKMFPNIYGFAVFRGNEAIAKQRYMKHIEEVRAYFRKFPDSFLEVDLVADPRWGPICQFLGEPVPSRPFPHANRRPKTFPQKVRMALLRKFAPSHYRSRVRDK